MTNTLLFQILFPNRLLPSIQFSSFAQSCPSLGDPMNRSMPGLPVHHQLPEFTQTHVHRVSDAIQPSHPLLSPSPPVEFIILYTGSLLLIYFTYSSVYMNPLQCSCLENPRDGGAWWAAVHGVVQSRTRLKRLSSSSSSSSVYMSIQNS